MAVYTEVSWDIARDLLASLGLGELTELEGCAGGIENTNYFVNTRTAQGDSAHVLTLFERLTHAQLPFYLKLMKHLASHGVPVPDPVANAKGDLLYTVNGKPATVVNRLKGKSELTPTPAHCAAVGAMLAHMHLAGQSFDMAQPNLRGLPWCNETVPVITPYLPHPLVDLLHSELAYQNHVAVSPAYAALPRGPVHADLFRDNVMFASTDAPATGATPELTGFFDFYFAGVDTWLFDLAVCMNDWCIDLDSGQSDTHRADAMLAAYDTVRPLTGPERALLPAMLRSGALRFWISRLWDFHLPREASMLKAHDPTHFERVLRQRRQTRQTAF
jgi:homoserine kinase type II